jgi:BirA family biotin operon repressor/biotin-[acetyl-CoA-carboxylase] ligase
MHNALPSTQDEAKRLALGGAAAGTLVAAERQTAGRGRWGRRWQSPPGGLWYSLVLRPRLRPSQVPSLAMVASLDWARVVSRTPGVAARVKWPNDVWVGSRKLAGVLVEMSSEIGRVHWVVLGVGVNINNRLPSGMAVPAVTLARLAGGPVDRGALLAAWLDLFAESLSRFEREGFETFRGEYDRFSLLRGRRLAWRAEGKIGQGLVAGVDADGRLRVEGPDGPRAFSEGEVVLEKRSYFINSALPSP